MNALRAKLALVCPIAPRAVSAFVICFAFGSPSNAQTPWQYESGSSGPIYYNGGNVGLGTTNPSYALDIVGTDTSGAGIEAAIENTATTGLPAAVEFFKIGGSIWGAVGANGFTLLSAGIMPGLQLSAGSPTNNIVFRTGNSINGASSGPQMIIVPSGNVGIGTNSPQHLLHVAGTIGAEEVIVSSTGADYVFQPDYQLTSLKDVSEYIKDNKHLPGIPSAAEVQEKGVSLGDMQTKLLAKIEELTLHMIEADERNNRLEQQNRALEGQVSVLGAKMAQLEGTRHQ